MLDIFFYDVNRKHGQFPWTNKNHIQLCLELQINQFLKFGTLKKVILGSNFIIKILYFLDKLIVCSWDSER